VRLPWIRSAAGPAWLGDGVVALVVLAVVYVPFVLPGTSRPGPFSPWAWVFIAGTALPLLARRRFPLLTLVAVFSSLICYNAVPNAADEPVAWGLLVAAYSAAWSDRRIRQVVLLLAIGGVTIAFARSPATSAVGIMTTVGGWILGRLARRRENRLQDLARRAADLERERELDRVRAAAAERSRIARDMHDILAHAVSLMVVQAEAGPVVVRTQPERAEQAFDAIAGAGRDAMAQLRRLLGLLRDEPAAPDDGHERGARPPEPTPTVAALPALIGQVNSTTGLVVELSSSGRPQPLAADAEVAVYRIVQEALTNTVKHAGAGRATVGLDWTGAELRITAVDDGGGVSPAATTGTPPPTASGGRGLIGIRERAAACGGTAQAGPVPGGFQVRATLPYEQPRAALGPAAAR
jgi:signal transduction histidine kinase